MGSKLVHGLHEQGRRASMEAELVFDFQLLGDLVHSLLVDVPMFDVDGELIRVQSFCQLFNQYD
ncbi:MAG: hypothetical protein WCH75_14150, partial [Candidatus Binatia bacterium]